MGEGARLLSVKEAAALLNISRGTLYHWISEGRAPLAVRLSARCLKFRLCDLEAWVARMVERPANGAGQTRR